MLDPLHVARPAQRLGILRTGHDEFLCTQTASRLAQESLDLGLAIGGICTHITEVAGKAPSARARAILFGIERAIKRRRQRRAKHFADLTQYRATGEAQIKIQGAQVFATDVIVATTAAQRRHCDGRINVIERFYSGSRAKHQITCLMTIGKIRAHDGQIAIGQFSPRPAQDLRPAFIQIQLAKRRVGQVAILAIPLQVALKKDDLMAALVKRPRQRPVSIAMAVAPG